MKRFISLLLLSAALALLCCGTRSSLKAAPLSAQPNVIASVPFQFIQHELVAQVRVNGRGPYAMLLDTGTSPSIIDLSLARQIGLTIKATGEAGSGGGTKANLAYETMLPRVEIGGLTARYVPALAMDLSGLSEKFGQPIQGVMGDSLLSGRVVQFDYPHRVARFYSHSPFPAFRTQRRGFPVTLHFQHAEEVHLSGVRVNGRPVAANLDTGSNSEFQLTPKAVQRLGLTQEAARAKIKQGAGFNGVFMSRTGTVATMQVGSIRVAAPPVIFWQPGTGRDDEPWDMNIGNLFWQNYIVTIDYQKGVVTLEAP